ncbi:hypothetical protein PT974_02306 [Cladobotryum mycophilum]|uniref:Transcription regulator n=1 Tax=Cladobotryum mycophilum TaxID=491253 RepID=A0ABR0SXR6_9HYPO
MSQFSLTQTLIAHDSEGYKAATQSTFLSRAAKGRVPKDILGKWLANDRLYIHGYIRAVGGLLSFLHLPETVPAAATERETANTKLLKWMIDALVNIHREEAFFVDTALKYGISVNLPTNEDGHVPSSAKLEGLRRFEALFDGLAPSENKILPWLEFAVVFWGTEKCYLDAWSGARAQLQPASDAGSSDADGGALRNEFIPNWSAKEFAAFVDQLGAIIDAAVTEQIQIHGQKLERDLLDRSLVKWVELLAAERKFWPVMES